MARLQTQNTNLGLFDHQAFTKETDTSPCAYSFPEIKQSVALVNTK